MGDLSFHERFEAVVVRTLDTVERTNKVLESARDRVTLSRRWSSGVRHTRRNAVASAPTPPRVWFAYLVDQALNTSPRPHPRSAVEAGPAAGPPAADRSVLQDLIAGLLVRAARLADRLPDAAMRARLDIVETAALDTRHWLLDEPRHTPEALLDIQASVQAIAKALAAIEDSSTRGDA